MRQVRYSVHNENSIDLVLFVNGILITGRFHLYYELLLKMLTGMTGLGREKAGLLFFLLALCLFLAGALAGAFSWYLGRDVRRSVLS